MNGCAAAIMPGVPCNGCCGIPAEVRLEGAVEHRQVLGPQAAGDDRAVVGGDVSMVSWVAMWASRSLRSARRNNPGDGGPRERCG